MVVELHPCVHDILCALGDAALAPIKALLTTQVALLQATVAQARVAFASLSIVIEPVEIASALVDETIETARGILLILPTDQFEGCLDLGSLSEKLEHIADDLTNPLESVKVYLNTQLAEVRRLEAYIDRVDAEIEYIQAVIDELSAC